MQKQMTSAKKLAYFAVLTALTVILLFLSGYMHIGPVNINMTLVPLVLCGMILGVWYSLGLGAIIGIIILLQGITGFEPFTQALFMANPVILSIVCILKTTLAGGAGALVYRWLSKNKYLATFISAAVVPIVNTGVFILGMLLLKSPLLGFLQSAGVNTAGHNIVYVILVFVVSWNFFIELGINVLLAPAIHRVIEIFEKR